MGQFEEWMAHSDVSFQWDGHCGVDGTYVIIFIYHSMRRKIQSDRNLKSKDWLSPKVTGYKIELQT